MNNIKQNFYSYFILNELEKIYKNHFLDHTN
jgi:hypothetical protein